ncbi:hypothetical protein [uncultured Azohydromonas sp.]|nr:hypothetical protein [uncultured Azohydromonas sp.]
MESILWVLQLLSVVALCRWALKQEAEEEEGSKAKGGKGKIQGRSSKRF